MLASPNYYTGVYNGSGAAPGIRNTSEAITNIFEEVKNHPRIPLKNPVLHLPIRSLRINRIQWPK
jgi:hypothetical protein